MPSLNLRLSREQHELLVAAARDSARSLQREIEWRLFRGHDGLGSVEAAADVRPDRPSAATGLGDMRAGGRPSSPSVQVSSSGCPGFVPAGVKCKLCGQVHKS